MLKIYTLKNIDPIRWNNFLLSSQNATVFNTIEWCQVWSLSYKNVSPLFIVVEDNKFHSAIPVIKFQKFGFKSYHSMPYSDYGGILVAYKSPEVDKLIYYFNNLAKGRWGMLSFSQFSNNSLLESLGFKKEKVATYILNLSPDPKTFWDKKISSKRRQFVRQAHKKGVKVLVIEDETQVEECYKMILDTAKRHKARPKFPLKFYINIFQNMNKFLRWVIAIQSSQYLATTINFVYRDTIIYWDGGSFTSALQYRPNDALMWNIIEWGCKNNYKYYDLRGSPTMGLARFKQEWGAKERYYTFYYKTSPIFRILKTLSKRI